MSGAGVLCLGAWSMSRRDHRSRPVEAVKRPEAAEARRLRAAELLAQGRSQVEGSSMRAVQLITSGPMGVNRSVTFRPDEAPR